MRILCYNVNKFGFSKGISTINDVVKAIINEEYDVLCLQDVIYSNNHENLKFLAEKLSLKHVRFSHDGRMTKDNVVYFHGNATLTNLDVLDSREYHVVVEGIETKSLLQTTILYHKAPVFVFNTHLCHNSEANRLFEMSKFEEIILGVVGNQDHFLCGTFNCLSILDYTHEQWTTLGYYNQDQYISTDFVDYMSTHGWVDCFGKCKAAPTLDYKIGVRVDYIWFRGNKWNIIEIHRILNKMTRIASNHLPIIGHFRIPDPKFDKLSLDGRYLCFPGYTVISFLNIKKEPDLWKNWYLELKKLLPRDIYVLLPLESFHMTVRNLFCIANFQSEDNPHKSFHDHVTKTKKDMISYVNSNFANHCFDAIIKKAEDIVFGHTFLIELSFQVKTFDSLIKVSKTHENVFSPETKGYHMTFAYKKDRMGRDPSEIEVRTLLEHMKKIPHLSFFDPTLCYFPDMTKFVPMKALIVKEKYKVAGFCSCKRCWPQAGRQTNGGVALDQNAIGKICVAPPSIPAGTKIMIHELNCIVTVSDHLYSLQKVPSHRIYVFVAIKDKNHEIVDKFGEKVVEIEYEYFGK